MLDDNFLFFQVLLRRRQCQLADWLAAEGCDAEEGHDADDPFKINDMRQKADGRHELPEEKTADAYDRRIEGRALTTEARCENREEEYHGKCRRQAQPDHHHLDDADRIKSQPDIRGHIV